ncbi:hypothetical protein AVEN_128033-1 [Araneus ventricosus]|uniref:Uncharacterized protein n=1 Tax=Araneus ventricosus TaxID=182803 RepID=A0A4Y2A0D0_ARAVE|nr:hypothetical protein AVEN_128033-1 [Araneus ventricosus]
MRGKNPSKSETYIKESSFPILTLAGKRATISNKERGGGNDKERQALGLLSFKIPDAMKQVSYHSVPGFYSSLDGFPSPIACTTAADRSITTPSVNENCRNGDE